MLKSAVKQAFVQGGNPSVLMVTPTQKQVVSGFAGIAEQRYQAPSNANQQLLLVLLMYTYQTSVHYLLFLTDL
jgi:hypothetical protein